MTRPKKWVFQTDDDGQPQGVVSIYRGRCIHVLSVDGKTLCGNESKFKKVSIDASELPRCERCKVRCGPLKQPGGRGHRWAGDSRLYPKNGATAADMRGGADSGLSSSRCRSLADMSPAEREAIEAQYGAKIAPG